MTPASTSVRIVGTGHSVPDRVLTNADLEQMVDTSDEWIVARTGIRERRIVAPGQAASDLAVAAARDALSVAEIDPRTVELILVATVTADHLCPSAACLVQHQLGAQRAAGFDIAAGCSGFVNALMTADHLLHAGAYQNAVVIGVDVLSSITNYRDRGSCILFGDGAGAVVLQRGDRGPQVLDHIMRIDGQDSDMIIVRAGGSKTPTSQDTLDAGHHYLELQGREVFRFAVQVMGEMIDEILERNRLKVDELDFIVPHQANLRILEAGAKRLGIDMDKVVVNIDRFGNTSSASIPIALDEAVRAGRIERGHLVALPAFGGGLTWGTSLVRW